MSIDGAPADPLVAFLWGRLDDDEAHARNAFADQNNAQAEWEEIWSGAVQLGPDEDPLLTFDSQISRHIERHDPARVLRDVEAKRRIVGLHARVMDPDGDPLGDTCTICPDTGPDAQGWPCQTLRLLALPYADHPYFVERWRL